MKANTRKTDQTTKGGEEGHYVKGYLPGGHAGHSCEQLTLAKARVTDNEDMRVAAHRELWGGGEAAAGATKQPQQQGRFHCTAHRLNLADVFSCKVCIRESTEYLNLLGQLRERCIASIQIQKLYRKSRTPLLPSPPMTHFPRVEQSQC